MCNVDFSGAMRFGLKIVGLESFLSGLEKFLFAVPLSYG